MLSFPRLRNRMKSIFWRSRFKSIEAPIQYSYCVIVCSVFPPKKKKSLLTPANSSRPTPTSHNSNRFQKMPPNMPTLKSIMALSTDIRVDRSLRRAFSTSHIADNRQQAAENDSEVQLATPVQISNVAAGSVKTVYPAARGTKIVKSQLRRPPGPPRRSSTYSGSDSIRT
ncbi:hypothetical protein F5Y05DRAFT_334718 [Hypoxylon sp. FL0543]|nr:hypothetical protein F5Y05DRAFT_334718 [Hypoxylon sp. FL0543]